MTLPEPKSMKITLKNFKPPIKKQMKNITHCIRLTQCSLQTNPKKGSNRRSSQPKKNGWTYSMASPSKAGIGAAWIIENGAMVLPDGTGSGKGNNIVTDNEFTNFELSMEWKIVEGGTVEFFGVSKKERVIKHPIKQDPKSEVLDNERHPTPLTNPITTKPERFTIWFNQHRMSANPPENGITFLFL